MIIDDIWSNGLSFIIQKTYIVSNKKIVLLFFLFETIQWLHIYIFILHMLFFKSFATIGRNCPCLILNVMWSDYCLFKIMLDYFTWDLLLIFTTEKIFDLFLVQNIYLNFDFYIEKKVYLKIGKTLIYKFNRLLCKCYHYENLRANKHSGDGFFNSLKSERKWSG